MIMMDTTLMDIPAAMISQRPMHWFNQHFGDEVSPHLRSVECLQITICFAQEINDYHKGIKPGPGIPRLRYHGEVLGLYLRIPRDDWEGLTKEQFVERFEAGLRACFAKLVRWLKKHDELLNEGAYLDDFERRMTLFRRDALKPMLSGHDMEYIETDRYRELKAKGVIR